MCVMVMNDKDLWLAAERNDSPVEGVLAPDTHFLAPHSIDGCRLDQAFSQRFVLCDGWR